MYGEILWVSQFRSAHDYFILFYYHYLFLRSKLFFLLLLFFCSGPDHFLNTITSLVVQNISSLLLLLFSGPDYSPLLLFFSGQDSF